MTVLYDLLEWLLSLLTWPLMLIDLKVDEPCLPVNHSNKMLPRKNSLFVIIICIMICRLVLVA